MLEKEAQVLYGALGVVAELSGIAAERLRPSLEQAGKGIKQNALPNRKDFNDLRNRGGKRKHEDAKQWQRAMPLGTDAHGEVSRSPRIQI